MCMKNYKTANVNNPALCSRWIGKLFSMCVLFILLGSGKAIANTIYVTSIVEFQAAIDAAHANDIIILANNTYSNTGLINIGTDGITVKAATPGGVIFNGNSQCLITGSHIIFSGFQYINGDVGVDILTGEVLRVYGNYNTITQCNFYGYTAHNFIHVNDGSHHTEISYCNLEAKAPIASSGPAIQITTSPTVVNYNKIRYCTFMNFAGAGGDFGNEPIRIGLGIEQNNISGTVVEFCYFENLGGGDGESVSVKSTFNVIRYNTFNNNPGGQLAFRSGSKSAAYGNFFINSGGVRAKEGQHHMIYNNYFQGAGTSPSIELMNYFENPLDSIYIYHNTFYNPGKILLGGTGLNPPTHINFANNIFYKTSAKLLYDINTNVTYTNNIFFGGANLGTSSTATEFTSIDPKLILNGDGYYGLSSTSPAINASNGTYPAILDNPVVNDDPDLLLDIQGQARPADRLQKDMGCDEFTTGTVTNRPLVRCDAGPSYLCSVLPVQLVSFNAVKQGMNNQLVWQTASEINNKNFEIQRSGNDQLFQTIGFVSAAGRASSYSFIDEYPLSVSYYRLLQRDIDGRITYSKIVIVSRKSNTLFSVFPNPTSGKFFIQLADNQTNVSNITIKDLSGRTVMLLLQPPIVSGINIATLSRGIYFVHLLDKENQLISIQKILKN